MTKLSDAEFLELVRRNARPDGLHMVGPHTKRRRMGHWFVNGICSVCGLTKQDYLTR